MFAAVHESLSSTLICAAFLPTAEKSAHVASNAYSEFPDCRTVKRGGTAMNANKFFNSSTLGNAGGFPFAEKLRPWTETSFEPPDWVEWEQGGDHEEFAAFLNRDFAASTASSV